MGLDIEGIERNSQFIPGLTKYFAESATGIDFLF